MYKLLALEWNRFAVSEEPTTEKRASEAQSFFLLASNLFERHALDNLSGILECFQNGRRTLNCPSSLRAWLIIHSLLAIAFSSSQFSDNSVAADIISTTMSKIDRKHCFVIFVWIIPRGWATSCLIFAKPLPLNWREWTCLIERWPVLKCYIWNVSKKINTKTMKVEFSV